MYNFYSFENCVTCSLEINKDNNKNIFFILLVFTDVINSHVFQRKQKEAFA